MIISKGVIVEYEGYFLLFLFIDFIFYKVKIFLIYLDIFILVVFKIDILNYVKFVINIGFYLFVGMGGKYELINIGGYKNELYNFFKFYFFIVEMKDKDVLLKCFDIGV